AELPRKPLNRFLARLVQLPPFGAGRTLVEHVTLDQRLIHRQPREDGVDQVFAIERWGSAFAHATAGFSHVSRLQRGLWSGSPVQQHRRPAPYHETDGGSPSHLNLKFASL